LRARLAALLRPAGLKHRLVTVLFADVVGSTAIASGLDAEDTLGLLSAALRRMAALVEAHQGRALRFTGDGVKAAFGMDKTREDDAERAVRAGLAILAAGREQAEAAARQHGITDFAVRVGVHSGDVALGEGVEDDNTAMGAAVNIAARMEQHAPPGGLLQARLDALPASERQAARQASVIGHVFWDDALQALDASAPQALPALQRATFVKDRDSSDFEGTPERQFDHHLLHQVTYDTLLKAERKLGHGAVARWLTERTQGRGAEFLAMTGEHAEKAGETALAIDCFEQAGAQAQKRFANAAATSWLRRAVDLLGDSEPTRRFELLDRLGEVASSVGDKSGEALIHKELSALLERHPDDARQAQLWFDMALLADRRSEVAAAERLSWQALELAQRCGAALWAAMAAGNLAYRHVDRQDYTNAEMHLELALRWARKIETEFDRDMIEAKLLTISAMILEDRCRLGEASDALRAVLSRGVALDSPRLQLVAISNLANIAGELGRWDERAEWGRRMLDLADSIGALPHPVSALHHLALAAQGQGDPAATLLLSRQALAGARAVGDQRVELAAMYVIGHTHAASSDMPTALEWLARLRALCQERQDLLEECRAVALEAACDLKLGQPDVARSKVDSLLERHDTELAGLGFHQTISLRWSCQRVLETLDDDRAGPLLEQLHADVSARAAALTGAADRARLIQAIPTFRDIVSAYDRRA
jgi:class 3 adenylate cyclase